MKVKLWGIRKTRVNVKVVARDEQYTLTDARNVIRVVIVADILSIESSSGCGARASKIFFL